MKRIYMDYAAFAPIEKQVQKIMCGELSCMTGNPGALHAEAKRSRQSMEAARADVARYLGAHADEIIFAGSGTEANLLAIAGVCGIKNTKDLSKYHAITSVIEHPSVLGVFDSLEKQGLSVTKIGVNKKGVVDSTEVKHALRENTLLVSVMYANNEIGTVQPIRDIAKSVRRYRKDRSAQYPLMHTDACQALNYLDTNVLKLGVDFLSANGTKIYGPSGVGLLYARRDAPIAPLLYKGSQERGIRSGTEYIAGMRGFAEALRITSAIKEKETARMRRLSTFFITECVRRFSHCVVNGTSDNQLPNIVNISFPPHDNEELVLRLDANGIAVSARSACKSTEDTVSYVVQALGSGHYPKSAIRFSMGRGTKKRDLARVVDMLESIFTTMNYQSAFYQVINKHNHVRNKKV